MNCKVKLTNWDHFGNSLAKNFFWRGESLKKKHIKNKYDSEEEILEAFRGYDLDADGYITRWSINNIG